MKVNKSMWKTLKLKVEKFQGETPSIKDIIIKN